MISKKKTSDLGPVYLCIWVVLFTLNIVLFTLDNLHPIRCKLTKTNDSIINNKKDETNQFYISNISN